jgi:hypothetical protein
VLGPPPYHPTQISIPIIHHITFPDGTIRDDIVLQSGESEGGLVSCRLPHVLLGCHWHVLPGSFVGFGDRVKRCQRSQSRRCAGMPWLPVAGLQFSVVLSGNPLALALALSL